MTSSPNIAAMLDALAPWLSRVELHADHTVVEVHIGRRSTLHSRQILDGEHDQAEVLMETLVDAAIWLNGSAEMIAEKRIPTDHKRPALEVAAALRRLVEQLRAVEPQREPLGPGVAAALVSAEQTLEKYGARV
jgi:hypothetical protein